MPPTAQTIRARPTDVSSRKVYSRGVPGVEPVLPHRHLQPSPGLLVRPDRLAGYGKRTSPSTRAPKVPAGTRTEKKRVRSMEVLYGQVGIFSSRLS